MPLGEELASGAANSGSEARVMVMKPADCPNSRYFPHRRRLDPARLGCVLCKRHIGPACMLVVDVLPFTARSTQQKDIP